MNESEIYYTKGIKLAKLNKHYEAIKFYDKCTLINSNHDSA